MGRYCTGDLEYKFWFACQPTGDILEYGVEDTSYIQVMVCYDQLKNIQEKVKTLKTKFRKKHKTTYSKFMNKIDKKGYLSSTKDKETTTNHWESMSRDASKIYLGEEIIKALKDKKDDLFIDAEC